MSTALIYVAEPTSTSVAGGMVIKTDDKELQKDIDLTSPWCEDNALGTDREVFKLSSGFHFWEGKFVGSEEEPEVETETLRPATIADLQVFFPELK